MAGPSYASMPEQFVSKDTTLRPNTSGEWDTVLYPNHVGGGWYELSDETRVQGRDEAESAEASLLR